MNPNLCVREPKRNVEKYLKILFQTGYSDNISYVSVNIRVGTVINTEEIIIIP